jgi:hypothetical protein
MESQTFGLLADILFPLAFVAVAVAGLRRRPAPLLPEEPFSTNELVLTLLALAAAAVGPNILVVAATPGMPSMTALGKWALIPSLILLGLVFYLTRAGNHGRLLNRLWVGIWVGAAASGFLDVIRLTGFYLGQMPGNMPRMFGVMLLDRMALGPSPTSDIVGYLYHFWNGSCFGLVYTLVMGRFRWWGGLVWGLLIEVGMMTTPPMVVAMDTGFFGVKFGPGLFIVSFLAHTALGIGMGVLAERYVRHRGNLFSLWKSLGKPRETSWELEDVLRK